ncbi:acyl-CoA dehydrogenase N-terminal domain-containing protein, partial [Nocardia sp. NPDC005745]|uniref:acyl-CoA dehydrogenase N-terminal domain-containing protein n=1 Tax=Nocardia sp. NPDC005745 TaxID=3157061 RepID=UPI0033E26C7C
MVGDDQERTRLVGHYKSNVRDLEFNLFEVLGLVLQPHFVMLCLSSLVVGLFGAVLMSSSPGRP